MRGASPTLILILILILVLASVPPWGCSAPPRRGDGSGPGSGSRSGAAVRPLSQLPADHRDLWLAWLRRASDWPARRTAALADPALTRFLVENLTREMLAAYGRGEITTRGSQGLGRFERAQAELVILGEPAATTLAELVAIGDAVTAHLCAEVLTRIGQPAVEAVVPLLGRGSPEARARGAELLGRLPHAHSREGAVLSALASRLEDDPAWVVRKAAAESLARRGTRDLGTEPTRRALSRALGDGDRDVARTAAAGLGMLGDPEAIPALVNYLQRVQREGFLGGYRTAQSVLRSLSGSDEDRDPRGWRDWWRDHRSSTKKADRQGR